MELSVNLLYSDRFSHTETYNKDIFFEVTARNFHITSLTVPEDCIDNSKQYRP